MTDYQHHPDLTCLAEFLAFQAGHSQIERYTYPFECQDVTTGVRTAVQQALQARANRTITMGRMHVELDADNPCSGRVVDTVAYLVHTD